MFNVTNVLYAATGVVTTFALLAWFARKERGHSSIADSLSRNAYGMYLLHYVFVTWLQLALLGVPLSGWVKATLVTTLHQVDAALAHFPRIIGMRDGQIAFDLPTAEVTRERLERLYEQHEAELDGGAAPADSGEPIAVAPTPVVMHCR